MQKVTNEKKTAFTSTFHIVVLLVKFCLDLSLYGKA